MFDDNGQGVRGDMKAVIRAILMDYDARGASKTGQGTGKAKEPALRLTSLLSFAQKYSGAIASISSGSLTSLDRRR